MGTSGVATRTTGPSRSSKPRSAITAATWAPAAQVAALIAEKGFESLDGPVVRVATPDVPIPFSPPLEQAVLPGVDRVREACRELLGY